MSTRDPIFIIFEFVYTGLAVYAAWENFVNKRISKFGFDAIVVFLGSLIDKKQAEVVRQSPKLIRRSGWMMLLLGIGGVYALLLEFGYLI